MRFRHYRRGNLKVKTYGTDLLYSAGELEIMHNKDPRALYLEAAAHRDFDPTTRQPGLFCAVSFEMMCRTLTVVSEKLEVINFSKDRLSEKTGAFASAIIEG
jgi:hypothetical protein